jgi:anthranilate synthase component I
MSVCDVQPGEVLSLTRTIQRPPDAFALFCALTDEGRSADTLLLESESSLLVTKSALRATCRGREVHVQALSQNGAVLLEWLAGVLGREAKVEREGLRLKAVYPPAVQGSEESRLHAPSPLDVLRALACGPQPRTRQGACLPLVAGVFAYDLLGCYETLPEPREAGCDWPDYEMWLPEQMIWLQPGRTATVVAQVYGGEGSERRHQEAAEALVRIAEVCGKPCAAPRRDGAAAPARAAAAPDLDDRQFALLVETLKQHIVRGDVFQIVPSRSFSVACADPVAAYERLRRLDPSPYMFLVNGSTGVLFGASPETAVKVGGDPALIEILPIAGTRPRSSDPDLDSRLEAELRLDEKEVAEHMMLVDLARNDVARVSEPGTRTVGHLLGVVRTSHVMHLVSHVGGRLRRDLDALHAYVATMNMGTLVGAPKLKAAELLRRYESGRRGAYGGAVGYFTADGRMDSGIVIRSAVVKDGVARVRAGAGVVYDSNPHAEAAETREKAAAVLQAIQESQ